MSELLPDCYDMLAAWSRDKTLKELFEVVFAAVPLVQKYSMNGALPLEPEEALVKEAARRLRERLEVE